MLPAEKSRDSAVDSVPEESEIFGHIRKHCCIFSGSEKIRLLFFRYLRELLIKVQQLTNTLVFSFFTIKIFSNFINLSYLKGLIRISKHSKNPDLDPDQIVSNTLR
jgi:hypothetical protein